MAEHTKGPWRIFDKFGENHHGIESGCLSIIVWGDISDPNDQCGVRGDTPEEALANARLIAAAPQMLSALKAIRETYRGTEGLLGATVAAKIRAIDEAIAAAEGKP